jgi:hypothetical protein
MAQQDTQGAEQAAREYAGPDVRVQNHGSLFLVIPVTGEAQEWMDENIQEGAMWWGQGLVVEPRYALALVEGMVGDGLRVE